MFSSESGESAVGQRPPARGGPDETNRHPEEHQGSDPHPGRLGGEFDEAIGLVAAEG